MERHLFKSHYFIIAVLLLHGCGGTIVHGVRDPSFVKNIRTAYIVENSQSSYIQNRYSFGEVYGVIPAGSSIAAIPALTVTENGIYMGKKRGDTAHHIEAALNSYGIKTYIVADNAAIGEGDAVVKYNDIWKWDLFWYIKVLSIMINDRKSDEQMAYGVFKNRPLHTFETPGREVPKILDKIFYDNTIMR